MTPKKCIICDAPRHNTELNCDNPECRAKVRAMPFKQINDIRRREAIEVLRAAPADGRGVYIHMTPKL